jgi:hypothetical protein
MAAPRNSRAIPTGAITSSSTNDFHGDNGAGLGASHQTGWTGQLYGLLDPKRALEVGK